MTWVSIHAPARGATFKNAFCLFGERFNPRARAGRDIALDYFAVVWQFQSTRPRGARRRSWNSHLRLLVSIHAPARGATGKRRIL